MSKSALIKRQTSHSSSFEFKQIKLTEKKSQINYNFTFFVTIH